MKAQVDASLGSCVDTERTLIKGFALVYSTARSLRWIPVQIQGRFEDADQMLRHNLYAMLVVACILAGCDTASDPYVLHIGVFRVVDGTTKEPVNVTVSRVQVLEAGGKKLPEITEMPPFGPYRVTWLGNDTQPSKIELLADGYKPTVVPVEAIESTSSSMSIGGDISVHTINMQAE